MFASDKTVCIAQRTSYCRWCRQNIIPGDVIRKLPAYGWIHNQHFVDHMAKPVPTREPDRPPAPSFIGQTDDF